MRQKFGVEHNFLLEKTNNLSRDFYIAMHCVENIFLLVRLIEPFLEKDIVQLVGA